MGSPRLTGQVNRATEPGSKMNPHLHDDLLRSRLWSVRATRAIDAGPHRARRLGGAADCHHTVGPEIPLRSGRVAVAIGNLSPSAADETAIPLTPS